MKRSSKILALSLVALLTMGIFAGCGNNDTAANTQSSAESSAAPEGDKVPASDKENNPKAEGTATSAHNADIIGQVTATDGDTLTVDVFEPHTSDVDLLTIKGSDLTSTGGSEMIEIADVINIKQVQEGDLVASSADVIKNGDMVAVVTNEDGSKELLILSLGE